MIQVLELVTPCCGVCRMIGPAVDAAMKGFEDSSDGEFEFKRLVVGVDAEAAELAKEHGIKSVPAFLVYDDGSLVQSHIWPGSSVNALTEGIGSLLKAGGDEPPAV